MNTRFRRYQILLLGLFLALMATGYGTADTRTGTIGEAVPLSGTAPGYDMVYLFMTGPGVPANGARMDNSNLPVVTGEPDTFTQVPVAVNSSWSYTWQTGRVSGGLAAGQYTIYAATQPAAKNALAGVAYSSTEIYLSHPVTTGSFVIQSDPARGEVTINGTYFGNTPLTQEMTPGTYQITISLEGYVPASGMYSIDAGETKKISVNLESQNPRTNPPTVPMTLSQESLVTTVPVTPTNAPLSDIVVIMGIITVFALTVWFPRR
jgi:hypothetical protein